MKVWIVSDGECCDEYRIIGIFSSRDKAQRYVHFFQGCGPSDCIEGYEVDELYGKVERGLLPFHVRFDADGTVNAMKGDHEQPEEPFCRHRPKNRYREEWLVVDCWARDRDHAIEIASEKRREWLKNQKPGEVSG